VCWTGVQCLPHEVNGSIIAAAGAMSYRNALMSISPGAISRPLQTVQTTASDCAWTRRLVALLVAAGCLTLIVIGFALVPCERGMGTHSQLGLPPCWWIMSMDMPCPTCGMTTAFSHAAHGHLWQSFITQPMGCVVALATGMTLWISLYIVGTGSCVAERLTRHWSMWHTWLLCAAVLVAWVYKVASYKGWLG
jgi:hypothetical protein